MTCWSSASHRPSFPRLPAHQSRRAKQPGSQAASHFQPLGSPCSSRDASKAPDKPVHVIPRVEYGADGRYVVICPKKGRLPFEPDSAEWFDWLMAQSSFRFIGKCGHFTAHHEWRVPRGAWRAHRRIRNHSHALRLAHRRQLTSAVLEQAAEALQAHLI